MTRSSWLTGALLAGLFLALHLPFLPPSLEDLDSINFAMGIRDFDVARHQPHPPGYPLFILAAKLLHALRLSEVHSLSLISIVGGALGVFGCIALFHGLKREVSPWLPLILVVTCPLYWMTAARPLSDSIGLAAAVAVQTLMVTANSPAAVMIAAAVAGLAVGLRSQVIWLTVPLLAVTIMRLRPGERGAGLVSASTAYLVGALVWAVPLVIVSGGPSAYWHAFFNQGAEDLSGVTMLATTHTVSLLVRTLQFQLIAPWGYWQTGAAVMILATLGFFQMLRGSRASLLTLVVAFGPYMVFDLLFQEAITTRYALPLTVPVAYLAVRGASLVHRHVPIAATLVIAAASMVVDDATLSGYAQMPAPAFRMLGDMSEATAKGGQPPILAMHRKDEFDMRRPIQWVGDRMAATAAHLSAPPKHEWLELVKYWNSGGRNPVWFIADPLRSDLALIRGTRRPIRYRWPFAFTALVGGARPNEMDWHVIETPDWYLGEGWALTPETAGIAGEDRQGPGFAPIRGWIFRWNKPTNLMVGGRNLASSGMSAHLRVSIAGTTVTEFEAAPGFFLRLIELPPAAGTGDYVEVTVAADSPDVAIEQFDAQPAGRVIFGFGEGWNELEYNPTIGTSWRWSTDRSVIRVRGEGHSLALTMRGEIEAGSTSRVIVRAGTAVAGTFEVGKSFSRTVVIPAALLAGPEDAVTIESSAWYVPAEKRWRSQDRRRLGLKLYECQLMPAS